MHRYSILFILTNNLTENVIQVQISVKVIIVVAADTKIPTDIESIDAPEVATDALERYEVAPAKIPAPVPVAAAVVAAIPAAPALWAAKERFH